MQPAVTIRRAADLPTDVNATYVQEGLHGIVVIRAELVTDLGAEVLEEIATRALRDCCPPRPVLQLLLGGLSDDRGGFLLSREEAR